MQLCTFTAHSLFQPSDYRDAHRVNPIWAEHRQDITLSIWWNTTRWITIRGNTIRENRKPRLPLLEAIYFTRHTPVVVVVNTAEWNNSWTVFKSCKGIAVYSWPAWWNNLRQSPLRCCALGSGRTSRWPCAWTPQRATTIPTEKFYKIVGIFFYVITLHAHSCIFFGVCVCLLVCFFLPLF